MEDINKFFVELEALYKKYNISISHDEPEPPPKPLPVLLDKQVRIIKNGNSIDIERLFIYQNPVDNRTEYIGEIRGNDDEELKEILMRLGELN